MDDAFETGIALPRPRPWAYMDWVHLRIDLRIRRIYPLHSNRTHDRVPEVLTFSAWTQGATSSIPTLTLNHPTNQLMGLRTELRGIYVYVAALADQRNYVGCNKGAS